MLQGDKVSVTQKKKNPKPLSSGEGTNCTVSRLSPKKWFKSRTQYGRDFRVVF